MSADPNDRRREVADAISHNSAWLVELSRHTDANGNIEAGIDRQLAEKYGVADSSPTITSTDAMLAEIRSAKQSGDTERAAALQQTLIVRVSEQLGEPVSTVPPGDGGPRGQGPPPDLDTADSINARIADAESRGDNEAAMRAKVELLGLRNSQLNPTT
jgi:hypothetical protein